jgi:hypothetical protein
MVHLMRVARQNPPDFAGQHLQRLALHVVEVLPVLAPAQGVLQRLRHCGDFVIRAVGLFACVQNVIYH